MTRFPFHDLHSFKDYAAFVRMCAPDQFPNREGVPVNDQWTLELAFDGLKEGLSLAISEKGRRDDLVQCTDLIDEAYRHYELGRRKEGFIALNQVQKILRKIRTR